MENNETYTYEQVREMFKLYKELDQNLSIVSAVYSGDPRFDSKEERKRLKELIPLYKKTFTEELRKIIGIDLKNLEAIVK